MSFDYNIISGRPRTYQLSVPVGNPEEMIVLAFTHAASDGMFAYETDAVFEFAMQELLQIYEKYGRFAEGKAVVNLFASYGFEPA